MPYLQVKNDAISTLAADISADATSLSVATGDGDKFPQPGNGFHITIDNEILKCTARDGDTFTVIRAQEGTTAAPHSAGAAVRLNITAAIIEELQGHESLTTGIHGVGDSEVESKAGAQARVDTHAALTNTHGATSSATANRIVIRDANARAAFAAPAASGEPLVKGTPITITELPNLTSGKVWKGDATNRPVESDVGAANVVDFQIFTSSGTWTKPSGINFVFVDVISGGGGGGAGYSGVAYHGGGGGGGGRAQRLFRAVDVPNSVAVTVGAGGAGGSSSGASGSAGGNSSFGSLLIVYGGRGGGGATSGAQGVGRSGGSCGSFLMSSSETIAAGQLAAAGGAHAGRAAEWGGGSGGQGGAAGGASVYGAGGGGGGGAAGGNTGPEITAVNGGGGAVGSPGADGDYIKCGQGGGGGAEAGDSGNAGGIPGGGGGGGRSGIGVSAGLGGAGARGEVRVWSW